jgi:hypothetical protein
VIEGARMMRTLRLVTLFGLALSACTPPGQSPVVAAGDDDPPLANVDELNAGAPPQSSLRDNSKADAIYPRQFDIVERQSPVKSQGSRGVCSIFATAAHMESLYKVAGMADPDFSEQYLQWSVKAELGAFTYTEGSSAERNLEAISKFGIPAESAWPYESFPWSASNDPACGAEESQRPVKCFTNGEPPEAAKMAMKYKLPRGKWLSARRTSIKDHLTTKKTPVAVGGDFFYQAWNHRKTTLTRNPEYWNRGIVTYPNAQDLEESRKSRAGHAFILVGWDDDLEVVSRDGAGNPVKDAAGNEVKEKGFFLFKNSWGTAGFGIENPKGAGYGWISMKYVEEHLSAVVADAPDLTPPPPPPTGEVKSYETAPALAIPDDNDVGVESVITIPDSGVIAELNVEVDITHSYVGDVVVKLVHGERTVVLLQQQGGGDAVLKKTFAAPDFKGVDRKGEWKLVVSDLERHDTGTLNRWALLVR